MARTIESPGVEIKELDYSLKSSLPVGTNVLVQGFAAQGPTDELLNITTISEFEQIYGVPTNAAERYFYHSSKQVLESPGNLLVTRLPYGLSGGEGYGNDYSALLFPVSSINTTISYNDSGVITATNIAYDDTLLENATGYYVGEPKMITLTEEEYLKWESGQINWSLSGAQTVSSYSNAGNAGIIVLNKIKVTNNNLHEGYYLTLRDNTNFDDTDGTNLIYNSVTAVAYDNSGAWNLIPAATITKSLTGTFVNDSISEDVDTIPSSPISIPDYDDVLIMGLFKLKNTVFTDGTGGVALQPSRQEAFIGSLDASRKYAPNGVEASYYLGTIVNDSSMYTSILTNPNMSNKGNWNSSNTRKKVRTGFTKLFAIGKTIDPSTTGNTKNIGNLVSKLERSLRLAENYEQIPLDLVCDGGLSTIWAASLSSNGTIMGNQVGGYDDQVFLKGVLESDVTFDGGKYVGDPADGINSIVQDQWETIYGLFTQFVSETRKDCMFIADTLKHIFVQKSLTTLADSTKNFSQHIYWPLKNLVANANSSYATTYANWVKIYDSTLGDYTWIPFSGYAANTMAKLDSKLQPWFAPAGLNNGLLPNIVGIAINPRQKERDLLYRISVNPVAFFPTDGYAIWGQKTLQKKPSAFDRINVRRLFLTLEKATRNIMRYFVFEPNTVFTRTRVINTLMPIFEIAKNNEGVYDYLIVCDERNNTAQVIDDNTLIVDIYIKPVRSAEYILVNFIATRTDQDFNELL